MIMKRLKTVTALLLSVAMLVSACTAKPQETAQTESTAQEVTTAAPIETVATTAAVPVVETTAAKEKETKPAKPAESAMVEINISQTMAEALEISKDNLPVDSGYIESFTQNDDGSYTLLIEKEKHDEMMKELKDSVDQALDELLTDEYTSFTAIDHNDDYSSFEIELDSEEIGLFEGLSIFMFYTYGGVYNLLNGTPLDNIHIDFISKSTGEIIESLDSGKLDEAFNSFSSFGDSFGGFEEPAELSTDSVEIISEYTLGDGMGWYTRHFYVVKNNGAEACDISTNTVAYDADGNIVSAANGYINAVSPGCTVVFYEAFETDEEIAKYEPVFSVKSSRNTDIMGDLEIKRNDTKNGMVMQVTNNGEVEAEYVELIALYFKDGELISYSSSYFTDDDGELKPGATISEQMNTYESYDSAEVYLSGGVHYGW